MCRVQVSAFTKQVTKTYQSSCGNTVAGRKGVIDRGLGSKDQVFMIVSGKEKTTLFGVIEFLDERIGQFDRELNISLTPGNAQEIEQAL